MDQQKQNKASRIAEMIGSPAYASRARPGPGGEYYLEVSGPEFCPLITNLADRKWTLIGLFCAEGFVAASGFALLYVFEKEQNLLVLVLPCDGSAPSIARIFPAASWPERECRDGFGITFAGSFDERRLFLHETYPDDFHPLRKDVPNRPVAMKERVEPGDEYPFRKVHGDGVYEVPVGPVHAGIIEPGHFRFSVIGEKIFNLEVRMFYKHRGIEKLAEGRTPQACVPVAEAVSGDESVANATAFCIAAETVLSLRVPDRALYLRTILLELERISSHLGDQAGMLVDVAFPLGASQFSVLREEVLRINAGLTGHRFLRGMVTVGGLSKDIPDREIANLAEFARVLKKRYRVGLGIVLATTSVLDRFSPTGIISKELLRPLNITGPAGRASGGNMDVRVAHPYGVYDRFVPGVHRLYDGDVLARFTVKASEILDSLSLIERLIASLPQGEVRAEGPVADGYALSLVESPRGENLCWVWIRNGKVERCKFRTASYCTWQAIEHAVQGEIPPDFPVINKSLNLSYAGTDL